MACRFLASAFGSAGPANFIAEHLHLLGRFDSDADDSRSDSHDRDFDLIADLYSFSRATG
jgi:hypothetical protein